LILTFVPVSVFPFSGHSLQKSYAIVQFQYKELNSVLVVIFFRVLIHLFHVLKFIVVTFLVIFAYFSKAKNSDLASTNFESSSNI